MHGVKTPTEYRIGISRQRIISKRTIAPNDRDAYKRYTSENKLTPQPPYEHCH